MAQLQRKELKAGRREGARIEIALLPSNIIVFKNKVFREDLAESDR